MNGMDKDMPMPMPGDKPMTMMLMTFFWGKNVEILFSGWPGYGHLGMYLLALFFVFALAVIVEFLSGIRPWKQGSNRAVAGLAQTGVHALRVALAYLVMLAVMSFNVGVLIVAIAGHTLGFLVFGSQVFRRSGGQAELNERPGSALPPMKC
ncbi:copper transporter 1-like [Aristolochia californica]|uniref:copper transporter 1-like n=1 Tax=Aristolochia californica TaxID=171875 RepID=UPI0035DCBA50